MYKYRLRNVKNSSWIFKTIVTLTYLMSVTIGYAIMLLVMSFNAGIFIATILGLTFGYFIFGYMKKKLMIAKVMASNIYNPEGH